MDSDQALHLVVPATLLDARAATERVVELCGRFGTEDRARYGTAVMEWLVNVVKHSYRHEPGAQMIVRVVTCAEAIELVVEDTGKGMAPWRFEAAPPDVLFDPENLATLPESGMGLAIIKSVMDSVRYRSEGGINRLTAVRRWQQ